MHRSKRRSSGLITLALLMIIALIVLLAMLSGPSRAGVSDVPASLREQAVKACTDDALRLCSGTVPDEEATISCMAGKRAQLGTDCRDIYDRVVRLLRR